MLARCVVQEEISRTKALPFRHNDLFGPTVGPILYLCNDEQKERFLLPAAARRDQDRLRPDRAGLRRRSGGMRTRAVRDGDHYVLNGSKRFITRRARPTTARWSA